jgi:hypothetical protein
MIWFMIMSRLLSPTAFRNFPDSLGPHTVEPVANVNADPAVDEVSSGTPVTFFGDMTVEGERDTM